MADEEQRIASHVGLKEFDGYDETRFRESALDILIKGLSAWSAIQINIINIVSDKSQAGVEWLITRKHTDYFFSIPPTHEYYSNRATSFMKIHDGKIYEYSDLHDALRLFSDMKLIIQDQDDKEKMMGYLETVKNLGFSLFED